MWDEINVPVPASVSTQAMVDRIEKMVQEETEENVRVAEQEWKRGTRGDGLSRFSGTPIVTLRPSGSDIDIQVRYVTRASERFELRNRLYQRVIDLLRKQDMEKPGSRIPELQHASRSDHQNGVLVAGVEGATAVQDSQNTTASLKMP
jgi:small-conductance mechanosensitive channel